MLSKTGTTSINDGDNKSDRVYLQFNDKNDDNNEKKQTLPKQKKNKWCCCYVRIPVTGKLKSKSLTWLLIIFIIDMLSNIGLLFVTDTLWNGFKWNDLLNDLKNDTFHDGAVDAILLWILRFILLTTLTIIAIKKGVPKELWYYHHNNTNKKDSDDNIDDKLEILISNGHENDKSEESRKKSDELCEEEDYQCIEGIEDNRQFHPKFESKTELNEYNARSKRSTIYKYCLLIFIFLLCTLFQSYIGVKSITFNFSDKYIIYQAICFGLTILCINIEVFLLRDIIENASDHGDNIIVKSLHPHPLEYSFEKQHHCGICRKPDDKCYRCTACNYDVCSQCFLKEKKRLKKRMKNDDDDNDDDEIERKQLDSKGFLMRSLSLCRPHWMIIIGGFIFLIICSILQLLLPTIQGDIFDSIIGGDGDRSQFIKIIRLYLIISIFSGIFNSLRDMMFQFFWQRLTAGIRKEMFANITLQDIQFFDDSSTGELLSRLGNDVWQMTDPIHNVLRSSLSNILLLFGGLILCFITSWRLSMLAFTTLAPILYLTQQYSRWSRNIWSSVWGSFAKSMSIAQQTFSNIRTVRAFGTELKEIKKYNKSINQMLVSGLTVNIGGICISFLTNYLDLGASVLLLYFGGMAIFDLDINDNNNNNSLTVGKLITFQLYWNMMSNAYKGLQNVLVSFTKGLSAGERVILILDRMSVHKNKLYDGIKCELDGNIFIENVNFTYLSRPQEAVLNGVTLNIKSNEVVAIVGKSGGGKTTLIHLLMRFYDISDGAIYYNSNKLLLNDLNLTNFRKQIGFVGQETETFDASVKDNIIYGVVNDDGSEKEMSINEIIHYSKLANCHEFVSKFDEGYDTKVGERGIKLSGGQKQRLAIARMLIKRPKILLLDEATSNLDTESEALVQAAIDKTIWYKNKNEEKYDDNYQFKANAVILIAHRLSTVINADKIAVIDNGKIVELGNHEELLKINNGVYKKLVQRQIQKEKNKLNLEKEQEEEENNNNDNIDNDDTIDNLFD